MIDSMFGAIQLVFAIVSFYCCVQTRRGHMGASRENQAVLWLAVGFAMVAFGLQNIS